MKAVVKMEVLAWTKGRRAEFLDLLIDREVSLATIVVVTTIRLKTGIIRACNPMEAVAGWR